MEPRRRLPIVGSLGPESITLAAEAHAVPLLKSGPREERVTRAADTARAWLADTVDQLLVALPPKRAIACAEGCAFCCHLKVIASPVEVLALAAHLRRTLTPEALSELRARVSKTDAVTHGMSTDARARAKTPCPVLVDGRCAGYAQRPLNCAGACSMDAGDCERAFSRPEEDIPVPIYFPQPGAANAITAGLSRATFGAGLDGTMLELIAGLRVALDEPDAEARWWRREGVFAGAVDAELAATLAALP